MLYKFKKSTGKDIGRGYPQITTYESGYDFTKEYSISWLNNNDGWKDREIKTPIFILNKSAKKTDAISSIGLTSYSFIFSNRFCEFLSSYKLPKHLILPLEIQYKENYLSNYSIFHICYTSENLIDFERSKFCVAERIDKHFNLEINSLEDYYKKKEKYNSKSIFDPKIYIEKFIALENADFDLFAIGELFTGVYINERLKNAIENEGFTGIDFIPMEKLNIGGIF